MQLHKTAGPENGDTNYHFDLVLLGGAQLYIHSRWPWGEVYTFNENLTQILTKKQKYAMYHCRGFGDIKMNKSWSLPSQNIGSNQRLRGYDGNDNPIGPVVL